MSESGHNLRIPFSRRGCRLPFETAAVGAGYASSGPVIPGYMTPEEIAARYGPPRPPANQNKPLSRSQLEYVVNKCRGWYHAARILQVKIGWLKSEMAEQGIQPPAKWEEVETVNLIAQTAESVAFQEPASDKGSPDKLMPGMVRQVGGTQEAPHKKTRLEIAREKLDRDGYLELKGQLGTDKAIIAQLGIATDVFYRLKEEWGIAHGRRQEIEAGGTEFSSGAANRRKPVPPPATEPKSSTDLPPVAGPEQEGARCPILNLEDVRVMVEAAVEAAHQDSARQIEALRQTLAETKARVYSLPELIAEEASEQLRELAGRVDDIWADLGPLADKYEKHRHQVGPGHYSERPDNANQIM